MKLFVNLKMTGKRRAVFDKVPYEINGKVSDLEDLITEFVKIEVDRYNSKKTDVQIISYLTEKEIDEQAGIGKISFGRIYSDKKADEQKAVHNAIQCFKDGLVRIFKNDTELTELDESIDLKEGDCITFIRLTFLAGRLW